MQSLRLSAATKASTDLAIMSGEKATESFMFVLQQLCSVCSANLSDIDTVYLKSGKKKQVKCLIEQ